MLLKFIHKFLRSDVCLESMRYLKVLFFKKINLRPYLLSENIESGLAFHEFFVVFLNIEGY